MRVATGDSGVEFTAHAQALVKVATGESGNW